MKIVTEETSQKTQTRLFIDLAKQISLFSKQVPDWFRNIATIRNERNDKESIIVLGKRCIQPITYYQDTYTDSNN